MGDFSAAAGSPAHDQFCSFDGAETIGEFLYGKEGRSPVVMVSLTRLGMGCLSIGWWDAWDIPTATCSL